MLSSKRCDDQRLLDEHLVKLESKHGRLAQLTAYTPAKYESLVQALIQGCLSGNFVQERLVAKA